MKVSRRNFLATVTIGPAVAKAAGVRIGPRSTARISKALIEADESIIDFDNADPPKASFRADGIVVNPTEGSVSFYNGDELIYVLDPGYGFEWKDGDTITIEGIDIHMPFEIV